MNGRRQLLSIYTLRASRISGNVTVRDKKGRETWDRVVASQPTNAMAYKFNPTLDVADLTGKVAIVTGGR